MHKHPSRGYVLLLALIFLGIFFTAATAYLASVTGSVRGARSDLATAQALAIAEAGVDHAAYELNQNPNYAGETNTAFGGGAFTIVITTVNASTKRVTATGYMPTTANPVATKSITLTTSTNSGAPSFTFGGQAGAGGINMINGTINGDVYSNGNIDGSGSPSIKGSVTIAGSTGKLAGSYSQGFQAGTTTGYVYAHTVNNTLATGQLRCISGTGNNKACTTTYTDPPIAPFPLSPDLITSWITYAKSGGTYSGNYSLSGSQSASLGPKEITGNLTLGNSAKLNLTGTLYVHGNLAMSGSGQINLDPSYGTGMGVVIVDGYSSIGNGATMNGTGQAGSYVMLLDTGNCAGGNCSGKNAIDISGNAGTVVLYAQNGTLKIVNSGKATAGYAYKLVLDGNPTITYSSTLANPNFPNSGSGGGWAFVPGTYEVH